MPQHFGWAKYPHKKKSTYLLNIIIKTSSFSSKIKKNHQDEGRKDPKTMNRHTLPWYKSCQFSV